ncbi:hypothetical protein Bsp3421_000692 [Burkholderia sp. FERM BP-3421]|uniref:hypothetical protein n=1 Tax=Burkholderia sp. FERM BP-3421 TaxID=1494466 RepID=UPI00235FAEB2|nr:hypothetical protein [Burkholderia sp. FERM BP-3421]WDD90814.1 hypothetical protein Bsp3421_000692 [Burkholderia sp. FERM BP-3421]
MASRINGDPGNVFDMPIVPAHAFKPSQDAEAESSDALRRILKESIELFKVDGDSNQALPSDSGPDGGGDASFNFKPTGKFAQAPAAPPPEQRCPASPDPSMARFASAPPDANTSRPPGDARSAEQIIKDNPLLKQLGNQSGIRDKLNQLVGGHMDSDPDQAYRAAAMLTYVKSSNNREGGVRSDSQLGNGKIDGFTKDGDARHGTEAGMLQDICKNGWSYAQEIQGKGHQLDQTSDTHVRLDGTNKDNLQWGFEQVGKYLGAIVKGIGKTLIDVITKGRFNPVSAAISAIKDIGGEVAKQAVKDSGLSADAKRTADKVFDVLDRF